MPAEKYDFFPAPGAIIVKVGCTDVTSGSCGCHSHRYYLLGAMARTPTALSRRVSGVGARDLLFAHPGS